MSKYTKAQKILIAQAMGAVFSEDKTADEWAVLFDDLNEQVGNGETSLPDGISPWEPLEGEELDFLMREVNTSLPNLKGFYYALTKLGDPESVLAELKELTD